ncbi:MAG: hypothetical protein AB1611_08165 [bacterium]
MEIYKNDYTKDEDQALWELHEIRHKLHKEFKNKTLDEINNSALAKYQNWIKLKEKV